MESTSIIPHITIFDESPVLTLCALLDLPDSLSPWFLLAFSLFPLVLLSSFPSSAFGGSWVPFAGIASDSLCPQFLHILSLIPSSSAVGSFTMVHSPKECPVAVPSALQVSDTSHRLHFAVFVPSPSQDASLLNMYSIMMHI